MNLFDKNNNLFCIIHVHKKSLIVNYNNENLLYDFEKYNLLLDFIEKKLNNKEKEKVLDYLINNSEKIKLLEKNKKPKKSNNKSNPNQMTLF